MWFRRIARDDRFVAYLFSYSIENIRNPPILITIAISTVCSHWGRFCYGVHRHALRTLEYIPSSKDVWLFFEASKFWNGRTTRLYKHRSMTPRSTSQTKGPAQVKMVELFIHDDSDVQLCVALLKGDADASHLKDSTITLCVQTLRNPLN